MFLFDIMRYRWWYRPTWRGAVSLIVEERYRYTEEELESLGALTSGVVFRWFFFAIGTHGCIMKLGSVGNDLEPTLGLLIRSFVCDLRAGDSDDAENG